MRFLEKTDSYLSSRGSVIYKKASYKLYVGFCCCLFPLQLNDFKFTVG